MQKTHETMETRHIINIEKGITKIENNWNENSIKIVLENMVLKMCVLMYCTRLETRDGEELYNALEF